MKKLITVALSLMFAVCLSYTVIAGSLDSPGDPSAGSGMYTLQNLYDYLTSGTALTVQTSFQEPTSGPTAGTMKTTKEIGDAVATPFAMCDATADKVASGTKFFSTVSGSWGVQTGTLVVPPTPTPYGIYASCKAILTATPAAGDGVYSIDPDGPSGSAPFDSYCDMTTDGGGWTLAGFKSTNASSPDFFSNLGTVVTNFGENKTNGDWSLDICNNKINTGADYTELAITNANVIPGSHRINDFAVEVLYKFVGTHKLHATCVMGPDTGTYQWKCKPYQAYSALIDSWYASGYWLPMACGGYCGGVSVDTGTIWSGSCGGNAAWNNPAYFWVR